VLFRSPRHTRAPGRYYSPARKKAPTTNNSQITAKTSNLNFEVDSGVTVLLDTAAFDRVDSRALALHDD
jgi:hypothetical protein